MYLKQHYVIKFVSDLQQVDGFHRVLRFLPTIKLKVALNTITLALSPINVKSLAKNSQKKTLDVCVVFRVVHGIYISSGIERLNSDVQHQYQQNEQPPPTPTH